MKQCPDHAGRYSTNAVIPRLVAEAIIDILEMVDVNHSKHQVSGMPTAENPVRFCEEVLVVQHPRQAVDVRHEVVMITFQIIPDPLPVKEIGEKTSDQKKRKRIEYIPRSNCGRLDHVRADIEDQHVGELQQHRINQSNAVVGRKRTVNHPRQREHRIDAHQDHQNMIEDPLRHLLLLKIFNNPTFGTAVATKN